MWIIKKPAENSAGFFFVNADIDCVVKLIGQEGMKVSSIFVEERTK
jgi:hypothetical protein